MQVIIVFLLVFLSWNSSPQAEEEKLFSEWMLKASKDHFADLKKKYEKLSTKDVEDAHKRAKKAKEAKDWLLFIAEYERVVAKAPTHLENIFDLCYARVQAIETDKDWVQERSLVNETIQAYHLSKTIEDKAKALLFYAHTLRYDLRMLSRVLSEISAQISLADLRKKFPELQTVAPFRYLRFSFNEEASTSPSVCLFFSHPLAEKEVNFSDFVTIQPALNGTLEARSDRLCLNGAEFGKTYEITLKVGFPSLFEEKLTREEKVSIRIPDYKPRLSFNQRSYVLRRNDTNVVPLSCLNVDSVKLDVFRLSDRSLTQVSGIFLQNLWGTYEFRDAEQKIYSGTLDVASAHESQKIRNKTVVRNIDLNPILKDVKPGLYVLFAQEKDRVNSSYVKAVQWVIVSDLGITTFKGANGLFVDVRSLTTARPLKNVTLDLVSRSNEVLGTVTTDHQGMASFEAALLNGKDGNDPVLVIARTKEGDLSFLYLNEPAFDLTDRGVGGRQIPGPLDAFLYTDRGVYRGGETVYLNTLLRDDQARAVDKIPLTFKLLRPDGVEVSRHIASGDTQGRYELSLPILPKARTGQWVITAHTDPKKNPIGKVTFNVEDFIPSRLLVTLKSPTTALYPGKAVNVTVMGKFLFGAVAAGLDGEARIIASKHPNPFPSYSGFVFGLLDEDFVDKREDLNFQPLNESGQSSVEAKVDPTLETTHPLQSQLRVTLFDSGGRPQLGTFKFLTLLQPEVIGIRPSFSNDSIGFNESDASFDVIAVDGSGQMQKLENLEYEVFREQIHYNWYKEGSEKWEYRPVRTSQSIQKGNVSTESTTPVKLTVPVVDWGGHRLEIRNKKTGAATSIRFSKGYGADQENNLSPHRLQIMSEKDKYNVGDAVKLHIQSPFDGIARVIIANQGVVETHNVEVNQKGTDIVLKTTKDWGTGAYVLVSAFRPLKEDQAIESKSFLLPKRAIGVIWIPMDPKLKTLDVSFEIPKEVRPRQQITIPVLIKGSEAKQVYLTISAVDEGILQLTDFKTPAPQEYFLGKRLLGVEIRDLYGRIIDPQPGEKGVLRSGGDEGALARNLAALAKRSFRIVSLYKGIIPLDRDGKGVVTLDLPDFNGTLRLMGVAYDSEKIGSGQNQLLVRDPVVIEPVLPRFLAVDDQSFINVSLHNVAGVAGDYTMTLSSCGVINLGKGAKTTFNVSLDKEASKSWRIPIQATRISNGEVKITLKGPNDFTVTTIQEITVTTAQLPEVQSYNTLLKPKGTYQFPTSKISHLLPDTIASLYAFTQVPWNVAGFIKDLAQYPYGCAEQITSKGFACLAASQLLPGNSENESNQYKNCVDSTISQLAELQAPEGNFLLWRHSTFDKDAWLTAYAVHFLASAQEKGFKIPQWTYKKSLGWLKDSLQRLGTSSSSTDLLNGAYALYVLAVADHLQAGDVRYFYDTFFEIVPNRLGKAFIIAASVIVGDMERAQEGLKALQSFKETPTDADDRGLTYGSEIRDEAGVIAVLAQSIKADEQFKELFQQIPSLITPLGSRVSDTHYLSTQEKAWLILAAFHVTSAGVEEYPKDIAITLNDQKKTADHLLRTTLDSTDLKKGMVITNLASHPIWVSLTTTGTPKTPLSEESQGIKATRQFFSLKGESMDLNNIKQGQRIIVVLEGTITAPIQNANLLIVDRLPAGLEIENAALSQGGEEKTAFAWLERLSALSHREIRDDQFVASIQLNKDNKTFKIAYLVRAIMPGTYQLPALFIEDMYAPRHFVRTSHGTVRILG